MKPVRAALFLPSRKLFAAGAMWLALVMSFGFAQTPTVTVIEARVGRLEVTRETSVVIRPEQIAEVSARTAGRILTISRRQDMPVKAGEVVIQLDTRQLELEVQNSELALASAQASLNSALELNEDQRSQAELEVRSAETSYRSAQQQFVEGKDLFSIGALSRVELNTLESAFLTAETQLNQAQTSLEQAERAGSGDLEVLRLQAAQAQNNLTQIQQNLADASITSPLTGEISAMLVEQGGSVSEGSPVFRVSTTQKQLATLDVPLRVANRLMRQRRIDLPYGGAFYAAQVISSSTLNPRTQLVEVTARIYPSRERIPNGSVTQFSYEYGGPGGIILPADAVQLAPGRRFVYLYMDGRAVRRDVEVLEENSESVAIVGIASGSKVIYPIPEGLREGQRLNAATR